MKFLIGEILICLVGASLLGVLVGWLLKTVFSGKKVSKLDQQWNTKFQDLEDSSNAAITEITEKNDILHKDISQQRSKMESLESTLKAKEKSLLEAQAEIKTMTSKLTDKQETLDAARDEAERLVTQQSELRHRLESIVGTKQKEIEQLKKDIGNARTNEPSLPPQTEVARATPVYHDPLRDGPQSPMAGNTSTSEHDARIKALNEQRQKLLEERKQLEEREKHFASKLEYGDDTRAYLDETAHMDLTDSGDELERTQNLERPGSDQDSDNKTLWDKVKSSVNKPKP